MWRFLQTVRQHQLFIVQHLEGRAIGHHRSTVQHDRPRTQFDHHFQVVRGDELGRWDLAEQGLQFPTPRGSRSLVGSSSTSTLGAQASTPARHTRRFSPWLR